MSTKSPATGEHDEHQEQEEPVLATQAVLAHSIRAYGSKALVVLFVLNAIDELDRAVLAVSLERIRDDFGLSDATVGLLPLAVIFITGLLSLPAGNLADRMSRTKILAFGSIGWGAAGRLEAASVSFLQRFPPRARRGCVWGAPPRLWELAPARPSRSWRIRAGYPSRPDGPSPGQGPSSHRSILARERPPWSGRSTRSGRT